MSPALGAAIDPVPAAGRGAEVAMTGIPWEIFVMACIGRICEVAGEVVVAGVDLDIEPGPTSSQIRITPLTPKGERAWRLAEADMKLLMESRS